MASRARKKYRSRSAEQSPSPRERRRVTDDISTDVTQLPVAFIGRPLVRYSCRAINVSDYDDDSLERERASATRNEPVAEARVFNYIAPFTLRVL